jgi:hypothetical protein
MFHRVGLAVALAGASAVATGASAAPREWAVNSLSAYPDALCLDGTPGAYYVLPGVGAAASTFVIHLQGGA